MNTNVRAAQVLSIDTPKCTSACAENSVKAASPRISCIERKWSWVIVAASFCNQFVVLGILQTLGLYNVEFLEALGDSKSKTAWITSVGGTCILGLGPLVAVILDKTSARVTACLGGVISTLGILMSWFASSVIHLSVTFGVIMGSGLCMILLASTVIVGQYFEKRRVFATSIVSCGGSIGCLLLPVSTTYVIKEYSWRGSLFLLAGLCFQTVIFSCLLRPAPTSNKAYVSEVTASESEKVHKECHVDVYTIEMPGTSQHVDAYQGSYQGSDRVDTGPKSPSCSWNSVSVMDGCIDVKSSSIRTRNKGYIITLKNMILQHPLSNLGMLLFCISMILVNIGVGSVVITLPDFIYILLGAKYTSAIMLMCIAAGRIGGAIIASGLGNWKPLYCLHIQCICILMMSIGTFLYTVSTNTYVLGMLSCLFGIGYGSALALFTQVAVNFLGTQNLAQTLGYMLAGCGVGRLTGPPIGGALFDISGDYMVSFWVTAGVMVTGGVLLFAIILRERIRKQYDVTKFEAQN